MTGYADFVGPLGATAAALHCYLNTSDLVILFQGLKRRDFYTAKDRKGVLVEVVSQGT